jgi:hypothetical protein
MPSRRVASGRVGPREPTAIAFAGRAMRADTAASAAQRCENHVMWNAITPGATVAAQDARAFARKSGRVHRRIQ